MAKAPLDVRSLARQHTVLAIQTLQGIASQPKCNPSARVAAATALLDRGWGKPTQPIAGDDSAPPIQTIIRRIVDPKEE